MSLTRTLPSCPELPSLSPSNKESLRVLVSLDLGNPIPDCRHLTRAVLLAYAAEGLVTYHDWNGVGCIDDTTCEPGTRLRYAFGARPS